MGGCDVSSMLVYFELAAGFPGLDVRKSQMRGRGVEAADGEATP